MADTRAPRGGVGLHTFHIGEFCFLVPFVETVCDHYLLVAAGLKTARKRLNTGMVAERGFTTVLRDLLVEALPHPLAPQWRPPTS